MVFAFVPGWLFLDRSVVATWYNIPLPLPLPFTDGIFLSPDDVARKKAYKRSRYQRRTLRSTDVCLGYIIILYGPGGYGYGNDKDTYTLPQSDRRRYFRLKFPDAVSLSAWGIL